jgi:uncharacterized repeat protein (TIGR01451 family)
MICALVLLSGATAKSWAEGEITLSNTVQKVEYFTNELGQTESRLIEAAQVVPGDELAYTITFENVSEDVVVDAGSVVITNPIPPQVVYLEGTAFGAGTTITFSADDGSLFGSPDQLRITNDAGEARVADASEYTHIRWVFEPALEPGQRGSVSFRGRLR